MADELRPAYFLTGTDRPKIGRALRRLRSRFGDEAVETLAADEASGEDVAASLNSLGLFGAGRLVIVQGVERWKKGDHEAVAAYVGDPAPGTVLALVADEPPKDGALAKLVSGKGGEVLAYDVPKPKDPSVWVRSEFVRLGAQATDDAAKRLVEIAGDDIALLEQEVEKLVTWAGGEQIGPREVEQLAVPVHESPAWALSDAWGSRNVGEVLAACEAELDKGTEPFLVAVRLASQVALVRRVQALAAEGLAAREIAGRLKKHEFPIRKALGHAEHYSRDELDAAIVRLAELDAALKGASRVSNELELERALVEITTPRERVEA
ncbi:MAG TPA: DNA polymerase III subunit delta [Gaiellaceae bacterium]|jgi:DNA polymerase-3 subunit delta|nr:DNA polymerase III subunit delta [Gaiellaceae bacterium]